MNHYFFERKNVVKKCSKENTYVLKCNSSNYFICRDKFKYSHNIGFNDILSLK